MGHNFLKIFIAIFLNQCFLFAYPEKIIVLTPPEHYLNLDSFTTKGKQDTEYFVNALQNLIDDKNLNSIQSLYSTNPNALGNSKLPYKTLIPLSRQTDIPIFSYFSKFEVNGLAKSIIDNNDNDNKVVVVALTKPMVKEFFKAYNLSFDEVTIEKNSIDTLWIISFNNNGTPYLDKNLKWLEYNPVQKK
jgi:hypothetical protein